MAPETGPDSAADLAALRPTMVVKVGGALLMLAGSFTMLLGAQTALLVRVAGLAAGGIAVMLSLGMATLLAGWKVWRGRGWAAIAGTITAGLTAVLGLGWLVVSLKSGLVSPLAMGILPLAALAAIMAALSIGPGRRADAARERLRDQGLETGA